MTKLSTPEPLVRALYADLADGEIHSGADLAAAHGVTRGGIWKAVEHLRQLGLPVEATPKRGYHLAQRIVPLAADTILAHLSPRNRESIVECRVLWTVSSTNSLLLEANNASPSMLRVLLAENQLAGRGRRGRSWQAPLGGGLCLSLGFGVDALPRDFGGLTLVIGLAVLAALRDAGARDLALKWPNDIVSGSSKIAGILTELRAEAGGPAWVVCGIGINVRLPPDAATAMASAGVNAGDLASLGLRDDRNQLAARVIEQCVDDIALFLAQGLTAFQQRWRQNDALSGKRVRVEQAGVSLEGIAKGIDAGGALQLLTAKGLTSIIAGDVSVRPAREAAR